MSEHLDLDALADALAGSPDEHLTSCAECSARLEELQHAMGLVDADLAALAATPLPAAPEAVLPVAAQNVLPIGSARSSRPQWLVTASGLAAAAVLVVGGGLLLVSNAGDTSKDAATATSAGKYSVNDSGTNYTTDASLTKALPTLLQGGTRTQDSRAPESGASTGSGGVETLADPQTAASVDPLAGLRTPDGLAKCLASLTDPSEAGVPLALDYATYKGEPALVVVLPSAKPSKVDIWVVGPACDQLESDLRVYVKADRPAP